MIFKVVLHQDSMETKLSQIRMTDHWRRFHLLHEITGYKNKKNPKTIFTFSKVTILRAQKLLIYILINLVVSINKSLWMMIILHLNVKTIT